MNMKEYLKKKSYLFVLTALIIIVLIVLSVKSFSKKENNSDMIQNQSLNINYQIANDLRYPMTLEDGRNKASSSKIVIKNNKSKSIKYKLVFKEEDNSTLPLDKVYISINYQVFLLSSLNDHTIMHDIIEGNSEKTIVFKTWVGLDLISSEDTTKELNLSYEIVEE